MDATPSHCPRPPRRPCSTRPRLLLRLPLQRRMSRRLPWLRRPHHLPKTFLTPTSTSPASSTLSSWSHHRQLLYRASLHLPLDVPRVNPLDELRLKLDSTVNKRKLLQQPSIPQIVTDQDLLITKLNAIIDAAADCAEMHTIICRQRDNWNHFFLHSINLLALTASLMAGLAPSSPNLLAFQLSSGLLLSVSAVMMAFVQPSQLAEEQRKATQLEHGHDVKGWAGVEARCRDPPGEQVRFVRKRG